MNRMIKRGLALTMVLVMCLSFLPMLHIKTSAADVNYVYDGKYIYNWGTRGTVATFLSPNAEAFYAQNKSYDELAAYAGGTSQSNAPTSALYSALKNLMVSNHDHQTNYAETRDLYKYTDCQNSGGKISSFYSGTAIGPAWDSGNTWNREHTWPNSKGLGGNDENDIMMLRPTSVSENSSRGNKAYGQSGSYYNPNSESGGKYDLRGDVARIFLYVYVRWGNTSYAWGTGGVMENVDVLLTWMEADPVDTWELGRNDSVEAITGTRNVFVDYPEFAFLLFGEDIPDNMSTPSGEGNGDCGHNNFDAGVVTDPTCTTSGYTLLTCQTAGCGETRKINIVAAVGHAFTAGVCVVCGETEAVAPKEPTYVTTPKTGTPYKLGFYSTSASEAYYFTGTMTGYYGTTDTAYAKGVDVYVEQVSGGYRLYFNNSSGQKQYINLVQSGTHYNFTFASTASSVFTWDSSKNSFYTTVGSETCYMGTYGSYKTMATITSSKMQNTDYFAHLYTTETDTPVVVPCEHNYQNNVCVKCGDVKACEHNYQNGTCTLCGKTQPVAGSATISFADVANRTEFSTSIQVWQQNGITVTNEKAGASSNVANYSNPARFYQGSSVTISYPGITKIEINCAGLESRYVEPWKTVPAGATVTVSNNVVTVTFSSPVDSIVYSSMTKQARAYSITVHSAAGTQECTHTNTTVKDAVDATCTANGFTGKTYCADCGELLNAGVSIPKADHEFGNWNTTTAPTCTTAGVERRDCNNCDHYETNALTALGHSDENNDSACDACGEQLGTQQPPVDDNENNNDDNSNSDNNNDNATNDDNSHKDMATNPIIASCNGVIGGSSIIVIALISSAAIMLSKKKEY